MKTETKVGHTPGQRSMQHRGDLGEYHSLAEGGVVVGQFVGPRARADALLDAAAPDLLAALRDVLGDQPDMIQGGEAVLCRHCGRAYTAKEAPVDATGCSDDCPGYLARAAIAKAEA